MNKSLITVAVALASLNCGAFAQPSPFVGNGYIAEDMSNTLLFASGGNPWALPDPNTEYGYAEPRRPPAPRVERPRYITPDELKQLDRLPPERRYYGPVREPIDAEGLLENRSRRSLTPGGQRYYGQGYYPSGSSYGSPYGTSPLYDPYGGSNTLPYGGILPFLY